MPDDEPKDPRERAREAWKDWTPADVEKELEPWPQPVAAEGADLDCWSPAAPAALALVADRRDASVIAAAIARGRERPPLVLVDRPKAVEPEIDVAVEVVNWCGLCGQTFRIAPDDPHWSTGRGPICPPKAKP